MRFEWDDEKRFHNIAIHGIDFADLEPLFLGVTVTILDDRFDYGEDRFVTFGFLEGLVVAVVHTETDEVIRVISARKATRHEETNFVEQVRDQLGPPEKHDRRRDRSV